MPWIKNGSNGQMNFFFVFFFKIDFCLRKRFFKNEKKVTFCQFFGCLWRCMKIWAPKHAVEMALVLSIQKRRIQANEKSSKHKMLLSFDHLLKKNILHGINFQHVFDPRSSIPELVTDLHGVFFLIQPKCYGTLISFSILNSFVKPWSFFRSSIIFLILDPFFDPRSIFRSSKIFDRWCLFQSLCFYRS